MEKIEKPKKDQKKTRTLGISKFCEGLKRLITDTKLGILEKCSLYKLK